MSLGGVARIQSAVTHAISTGGLIALVAMACMLIGACGSSSTSSTSSPSPSPTPTPKAPVITKVDACSLVMVAEAASATGVTVANIGAPGIAGACYYSSSDGTATVLVFAQAYPDTSSANAVSPEQVVAALHSAYGIANAKVVSGIGDKAVEYSLTGAATGYVIFVFKSNVVIMIAVSPATSSSAVEQLAKTAVGRL